jgi:hypothetical protein buboB_32870
MQFLLNGQYVELSIDRVVNAGYAGCDQRDVKAHIDELAAIGVNVPKRTPTFYPVPVMQLTRGGNIQVGHGQTSAEIEYVYIQVQGKRFISVGSDHSDRALEAYSVNAAKQICPDLVAAEVWDYDEVADHFGELMLTCEVYDKGEWRVYQQGPVSELLPPEELLKLGAPLTSGKKGLALYSGTIPTIGEITYARQWRITLCDRQMDRTISFEYTVEILPECIE